MAPWTEKLTLESARQVRRWTVSAIECSANTTSAYIRNWRSTMPWFFPPSSMVVRRGHCIAGISKDWSSSACELSAPSWESGGRSTSPIWSSSIKLSPPSSRPNFDGLDTWFEWKSVGCRDAWCTGNSRPTKETKVDQNGQSQSPVVPHQSTRPGGICHGQTKMARFGSQSCCQLRRGSMPEIYCCQRETPQSSLGSDHNNWLPVPPLFKTLGWGCGATSVYIDEL